MFRRYKEILFGFLLGLAMWASDALMHTMMPMSGKIRPPTFVRELFYPDQPQLFTRLLFVAFALFVGWLLWRSNAREREVRDLTRQIAIIHERTITPATMILDGCNTLIRCGGLTGENLELVKEIRVQARQIDSFVKDFPRRYSMVGAEPAHLPKEEAE